MIFGIDFDNTIVCYDKLFHQEAVAQGLVPESVPARKNEIRNYLRNKGNEDLWTSLQGYIYGPGIRGAEPFPFVFDFFKKCLSLQIKTYIISHKTQYPYAGGQYNLHESALAWLEQNRFLEVLSTGLGRDDVIFAPTKERKLLEIEDKHCSHFIDDLPEFLDETSFPKEVCKILFDPNDSCYSESRFQRISSWSQALDLVEKVAAK
ncbi:MAG: hypothetical protein K8F91_09630 [Candidatus Obscuribacterales bacterium]|nr:hypothetical protein [Candidatus Obscuribacterales bacterium]